MEQTVFPKIFLIHAAAVSVAPINQCFASIWPQARIANLLEDALYDDLKEAGGLTKEITRRIILLGEYCELAGAHALLFTGSAFGPAVDQLQTKTRIPVLKPNEALYEEICTQTGRVALLSTVPVALSSMMAEIKDLAAVRGKSPAITPVVIDRAFEALQAGDDATHDRLVGAAIKTQAETHEVIALGQFSMWTVGQRLRASTSRPIITTPDTAVEYIQRLLRT
jgi:aspartate/glutamate racemase